MLTLCWAVKGGSGASVVAAGLAVLAARHGPALLVDLAGDGPAVLGIADPAGVGVCDWLLTPHAATSGLDALTTTTAANVRVAARGRATVDEASMRWEALIPWLGEQDGHVVIDAGTGRPPAALAAAAHQRLLVTRPCYLALRHAAQSTTQPSAVVVIVEPGRALGAADVAATVHAPVVAEIAFDPVIARAVDAGLLASRMPRALTTPLQVLLG